jgi:lipopolysaccharide biosynthesis glycosyltransferase
MSTHRLVSTQGETVVALATDAARGFLPIIGVVNSTVHNSKSDVGFVIVTTRVHFLKKLLDRFFPSLRVAVCSGAEQLLRHRPALQRLSSLVNSTNVRRKELLSPFNFAAFYMPHVLYHTRRVIYLDTDIVVTGDVLELATLDLHNKAVAAVNDCSQKIAKYFDEKLLPIQHKILWQRVLRGDGCVFNRGVVVFDTLRWRTLQLTETIEDLVDAFVDSKAKLWSSGISQPPFLLALAGRYEQLPVTWNVRGLGRLDIGRNEWRKIKGEALHFGVDASVYERHLAPAGPFRERVYPFFHPLAAKASLLHFNGDLKPWALTAEDARNWHLLGLRVSSQENVPHVLGTCRLKHCASSYNLTTDQKMRSACEASLAHTLSKSKLHWDQIRLSPNGRRWPKHLESVAKYYESGCVARPPLCTCRSQLSDDCVTSCASLWHAYVSPEVIRFHDAAQVEEAPPATADGAASATVAGLALAAAGFLAMMNVSDDEYEPPTDPPAPARAERPSRLYPQDVPGCVTAGRDHHCRGRIPHGKPPPGSPLD